MSLLWSVDPKEELCKHKIPQIFYSLWRCVHMVVASFAVVAETVGVLHTQVKTLGKSQEPINSCPSSKHFLSVQAHHIQGCVILAVLV